MATWVASYLEAPVSNVDLVADMVPLGRMDPGGLHRRGEDDKDETSFRYWVATQPDRVRAWNSYFDTHGVDIIITPPQMADAISYVDYATGNVPIRVSDGDGCYKIEGKDVGSSNYLHYMAFKSIPIPKLVVPTGLDALGRPTAVEFWGRAVPSEKLY